METLEQLKTRIEAAAPAAQVEIVPNGSPAGPASLLLDRAHARAVAEFLRDDPALRFDYASNVTGVDWPEKTIKEKVKVKKIVDGVEKEVEEVRESKTPAYLEAVYHLYSIALKQGPLALRLRTENRADRVSLPSLTPVWRSCEFQEREIFDLFGITFEGHPDLRRILMWPEFTDHPMRKDYAEPDDYEYEPTPHDDVLARAKQHQTGGAPA
ncbi:MAG TPA: NADH-quinone oxidoreductase subunit C [Verrucomicrobiae bacterium]|jgi:NADH-quinone oxidoreductase subunit C